jgi:catechol 2,3-dioxygenase-like lactoylglutathione lyase family enzyme
MLGEKEATVTIPVKELARAKKFYEGTIGMKPTDSSEMGVQGYKSGGASVMVYESQFAGTNKATAVTWMIDDVEGAVKELKAKGVTFEHYDMPNTQRQGDIHVSGDLKNAWFKDPDGNILAIVGR